MNLLSQALSQYLADIAAAVTVAATAWIARRRGDRRRGRGPDASP